MRSVIIGSGSEIAPNLVTNDMLGRIMDTSDEWIRERTGVESRYFVDPGTTTSQLGEGAARKALEAAGLTPTSLDLIVFATMTPDYFFPGCGGLLAHRLGMPATPAFDIRQQCSGFLYGLQLADAHIRSGLAKRVLVVGAEVHSGFMPWREGSWARLRGEVDAPLADGEWEMNTATRDRTVLFGDAGAAVILEAQQGDDPAPRGVLDTTLFADGGEADKLCVPGIGFRHRPYVDAAMVDRADYVPVMEGRHVFRMATTKMAEVSRAILQRNGIGVDQLSMVLMHQANKRINEFTQRHLHIPDAKVAHNIHKYANTTAGTIPLLWDECCRDGRIRSGDLVLMVAFGAGMTWGAALVRA
jgi:3-oxoacyl-[acyl-carrier-protein] synthase-3